MAASQYFLYTTQALGLSTFFLGGFVLADTVLFLGLAVFWGVFLLGFTFVSACSDIDFIFFVFWANMWVIRLTHSIGSSSNKIFMQTATHSSQIHILDGGSNAISRRIFLTGLPQKEHFRSGEYAFSLGCEFVLFGGVFTDFPFGVTFGSAVVFALAMIVEVSIYWRGIQGGFRWRRVVAAYATPATCA